MANEFTPMAAAVVRAIRARRPKNVELSSVSITSEGSRLGIVVLPHRDLGGFSLVISITADSARFSWAAIGDFKYHDDIDLGLHIPGSASEPDLEPALAKELIRPIGLSWRRGPLGRWSLYASIRAEGLQKSFWLTRIRRGAEREVDTARSEETFLMGPSRPSYRLPVPVAEWRKLTFGIDER